MSHSIGFERRIFEIAEDKAQRAAHDPPFHSAIDAEDMLCLIDSLGRDYAPLNFLRELIQSSVESVRDADETGEITWHVKFSHFDLNESPGSKLAVRDTGIEAEWELMPAAPGCPGECITVRGCLGGEKSQEESEPFVDRLRDFEIDGAAPAKEKTDVSNADLKKLADELVFQAALLVAASGPYEEIAPGRHVMELARQLQVMIAEA